MRFLPMWKKRAKNIPDFLRAGTLSFLLLNAGCATPSRVALCSSELPEINRSAQDALAALSPWTKPYHEGRMLASSSSMPGSATLLTASDRSYWRSWAELRLFEVQRAMDLQESERRGALRRCLSSLANELVTFHGYATQGRADRMEKSLQKISSLSAESEKEGCP